MMRKFGLIGKNISYSFSKTYFTKKFKKEGIQDATYENYDIQSIKEIKKILTQNPEISGLNVTIPYKEKVIPLLNKLNKKAQAIGAVNTIKITNKKYLKGYNTDCYGFKKAIKPFLKAHHRKALILGTGGASKAIAFALDELSIEYKYVSRKKSPDTYIYSELNEDIINAYPIIINCTPVGTHPNINNCPKIPYKALNSKHLLFDLIYNPSETLFLTQGKQQGSAISNGIKMLELQADKAWNIWNK